MMACDPVSASLEMFHGTVVSQSSLSHLSASSSSCILQKQGNSTNTDQDVEDTCSTHASDGPDHEYGSDDSDDDQPKNFTVGSAVGMARKQLWADLIDDEEDFGPWTAAVQSNGLADSSVAADTSAASSKRWADLEDSDEDRPWQPAASTTGVGKGVENKNKRSKKKGNLDKDVQFSKVDQGKASSSNDQHSSKKQRKPRANSKAIASQAEDSQSKPSPNRRVSAKGSGKGTGKHDTAVGNFKGAAKHHGKTAYMSGKRTQAEAQEAAWLGARKLQCQFIIGIEEDAKFKVVRRLLGPQGQNMKSIAAATNAKLRLRGRGSKFLEGPEEKESTDDLMLCVSCQDSKGYDDSVEMVSKILVRIYRDYDKFCEKAGKTMPRLQIQLHEGAREGSR